jgi:predicted unusual protein kinase regulating ubiquinone biosynthesis (AarF/ABC1/UbiB family)
MVLQIALCQALRSFRIPPYYTLLVRSLTVLEGIALASNPQYKVCCLVVGLKSVCGMAR